MKKGIIVLAIVAVIALYILNKVQTAKQLEFSVGIPRNVRVSAGNVLFDLPLNAQNVTQGSVRIKAVDMDVYSAGKYLGKALMTTPTTIVPASTTTLVVNVQLAIYDVVTALGSVINLLGQGKVSLKLDGLVYAEGVQLPVAQSFDFTLPKF
jgi:LEA14-like dessication related protein